MLLCWLSVGPQGTGKKSWSKIVRVTQNHANVKHKIACTHHLSHLALPILKVPFHILPTLTEPSTNASNCLEKLNYTSISMVMSSPFEKIITSQVPWGFRLCFPLVISGAIFETHFWANATCKSKYAQPVWIVERVLAHYFIQYFHWQLRKLCVRYTTCPKPPANHVDVNLRDDTLKPPSHPKGRKLRKYYHSPSNSLHCPYSQAGFHISFRST